MPPFRHFVPLSPNKLGDSKGRGRGALFPFSCPPPWNGGGVGEGGDLIFRAVCCGAPLSPFVPQGTFPRFAGDSEGKGCGAPAPSCPPPKILFGGGVGEGVTLFSRIAAVPPFRHFVPLSHAGRDPRSVTVRAANALTHVALRQQLSTVGRKQCSTPLREGQRGVERRASLARPRFSLTRPPPILLGEG